jgi:hypothetical protein
MLDDDLVRKSDELYLVGEQLTEGSGERATGLYRRVPRYLDRFDVRLNGAALNLLSTSWDRPGRSSSPRTARSPFRERRLSVP